MTTSANRIEEIFEEIFQDARELQADALEMLTQGRRNAAEKSWGATKRTADALILARTGEDWSGRPRPGQGSVSWNPWTRESAAPTGAGATMSARPSSTARVSTTAGAIPWKTPAAGSAGPAGTSTRSHSATTVISLVISLGTAGAKACSSSTIGSIQAPRWLARRMRQATGMAQPRQTTLMTLAVVSSPCNVGSTAGANRPERHQARTHSGQRHEAETHVQFGPAGTRPVAAVVQPLPETLTQAVPVAPGGEGGRDGILAGAPGQNGPATHRGRPVNWD